MHRQIQISENSNEKILKEFITIDNKQFIKILACTFPGNNKINCNFVISIFWFPSKNNSHNSIKFSYNINDNEHSFIEYDKNNHIIRHFAVDYLNVAKTFAILANRSI